MSDRKTELQAEALRRERERLEGRTDAEAVKARETLDWLEDRARDNRPSDVATRIRADEATVGVRYGVTCEGGVVRPCTYLGPGLGYTFRRKDGRLESIDGDEMVDVLAS